MIVATIYRIFFTWKEYEAMRRFEAENTGYKKVSEDTTGTMFEYRADFHTVPEERKEE